MQDLVYICLILCGCQGFHIWQSWLKIRITSPTSLEPFLPTYPIPTTLLFLIGLLDKGLVGIMQKKKKYQTLGKSLICEYLIHLEKQIFKNLKFNVALACFGAIGCCAFVSVYSGLDTRMVGLWLTHAKEVLLSNIHTV